jgi:hypothetical protein
MPEEVALRVLQSGKKHEVGGCAVNIAKSNSAGSENNAQRVLHPFPVIVALPVVIDPKYCTCKPNALGFDRGMERPDPKDLETTCLLSSRS